MAVSEFELIETYFSHTGKPREDVVLGVGDDCALLRPPRGQLLAVSIDTLVEGVHFLAGTDPEALGHKALAVNLSDLAAVGASPAWATLALTLPGEMELAEAMAIANPGAIHAARQGLRATLAKELQGEFRAVMATMQDHELYSLEPQAIGRRSLKNLCLGYLALLAESEIQQACFEQFIEADNMRAPFSVPQNSSSSSGCSNSLSAGSMMR